MQSHTHNRDVHSHSRCVQVAGPVAPFTFTTHPGRTRGPWRHNHVASMFDPEAHGDTTTSGIQVDPEAHGDITTRHPQVGPVAHGATQPYSDAAIRVHQLRQKGPGPSSPFPPATVMLRPSTRPQIEIEIETQSQTLPSHSATQIEIEIEIETQAQILPSHIGHSAMRARNQPHCWHALLIRPRPVCCPWWACRSVHA